LKETQYWRKWCTHFASVLGYQLSWSWHGSSYSGFVHCNDQIKLFFE